MSLMKAILELIAEFPAKGDARAPVAPVTWPAPLAR